MNLITTNNNQAAPVSKTQSKGQRLIRKEISEDSKKLLRVCEVSLSFSSFFLSASTLPFFSPPPSHPSPLPPLFLQISPYVPTSLQEEAQWLRTSIVSVFLKLFQPLFLYTSLASKKKPQSHLGKGGRGGEWEKRKKKEVKIYFICSFFFIFRTKNG